MSFIPSVRRVPAVAFIATALLAFPAIASAGTLYVNHTATPTATDNNCSTAAFSSVQTAVNAAKSGDQVYLCGTTPYTESVVVYNKNVNLGGDPGATLQAPGPASSRVPVGPSNNYFGAQQLQNPNSVLSLIGNINVQVNGLIVEGPFVQTDGCGAPTSPNQTDQEYGILVIGGARAQLNNDSVLNIAPSDPSLDGCQYGVAIEVGSEYWPNTTGANGGYTVVNFVGQAQIQNTKVSGYAKNGPTVDGPGSQAQIQSTTVTGFGQTSAVAQNGIQISDGATGQVQNDSVNDNEYTGPGGDAPGTGVLVFGGCGYPLSTGVQVNNNTFTDDDAAVDVADYDPTCSTAPSTQTNNQVHDNVIVKNDGVTNHSPFTAENGESYTGYQVGVADTGNGDQVHDNKISSTDGAFGPLVAPGGPFLAPIDIQTYPPINAQVHNNTYNGAATNPPY